MLNQTSNTNESVVAPPFFRRLYALTVGENAGDQNTLLPWLKKEFKGPDGHIYAMSSDHPDAILDMNTKRAYLLRSGCFVDAVGRLAANGKPGIVEVAGKDSVGPTGCHTEFSNVEKANAENKGKRL